MKDVKVISQYLLDGIGVVSTYDCGHLKTTSAPDYFQIVGRWTMCAECPDPPPCNKQLAKEMYLRVRDTICGMAARKVVAEFGNGKQTSKMTHDERVAFIAACESLLEKKHSPSVDSRVIKVEYTDARQQVKCTMECGHFTSTKTPGFYPAFGILLECPTCTRDNKRKEARARAEAFVAGDQPTLAGLLLKKSECNGRTAREWFSKVVRTAGLDNALAILMSYGAQHTNQLEEDPRYFVRACDRFLKSWEDRHSPPTPCLRCSECYEEVCPHCGMRLR